MVNLYQLYFSSSHFLSQPNKKVFHPSTFPPFQPNTNERKLNLFYHPTFPSSHNFLSSHFSTTPTKWTLKNKVSLQTSLERNFLNFSYLFFGVNFENLTVEFHILYVLNMHIKFRSNRMLFTIRSINLFFMYDFILPKLEI